jgi:L-arginine dehydrogenase
MQIRVIDEATAMAALDRGAVVDALRAAFIGLANGTSVQPAQTLILLPGGGDAIFYPGLIGDLDVVGVKLSPYIPARTARGLAPTTAYTLLLSTSTGEPRLLCDSAALTTARTAATTALALRHLATSARSLAVIGAGKVALEHVRYAADWQDWSAIQVYSPSLVGGQRPAAVAELAECGDVAVAASPQEAVAGADVVMLCTSSATPVIEAGWLAPDVVVTSITTNAPLAHEIDPEALAGFAVYCDYRPTAPVTAGEMVLAARAGTWSPTDIRGDLPELLTGQVEPPRGGKVFFRSTGLGIEDLAVASLLD